LENYNDIKDCPVDIEAKFLKIMNVTDLNNDGIGEI
jgi:hypothetical protein